MRPGGAADHPASFEPTHLLRPGPAILLAWTGRRALVATGIALRPVAGGGNVRAGSVSATTGFPVPGLGFRLRRWAPARVVRAMVVAGLKALAQRIPASTGPGPRLMPDPQRGWQGGAEPWLKAVASRRIRGLARLATTPEASDRIRWIRPPGNPVIAR